MDEMPTPETVEAVNQRWWSIHCVDVAFHAKLPLDRPPIWPLRTVDDQGRPREETVGPFHRCPLPILGFEMWGFARAADRDRFVALYSNFGAEAI